VKSAENTLKPAIEKAGRDARDAEAQAKTAKATIEKTLQQS
jgi:hypothetical protein